MNPGTDASGMPWSRSQRHPGVTTAPHEGGNLLAVVGRDGAVLQANVAWRAWLGRDARSLLGRRFDELLHPQDRELARAELASVARRGGHGEFVVRQHRADGGYRLVAWLACFDRATVYLVGRPLADRPPLATPVPALHPGSATTGRRPVARTAPDGGPSGGHRGGSADVHSGGNAGDRPNELNALSRLTAGIAHDVNNRLQVLRNIVALIRMQPADAAGVGRWADSALRVVDSGARLTAQLLAFSRSQHLQDDCVTMAELLRGLQGRLQAMAPLTVRLRLELAPEAGSAMVDRGQLELAIVNLAENAVESMPAGGELRLAARHVRLEQDSELPTGDYVLISIADTGAGMSDAVREHAFEPFFTTKATGTGPGLGLSQVYGFARQSGGTARVTASGPQGTTVSLWLPVWGGLAPQDGQALE
jgi:signal transduction histidine kinase